MFRVRRLTDNLRLAPSSRRLPSQLRVRRDLLATGEPKRKKASAREGEKQPEKALGKDESPLVRTRN
jgi:hypothetical protein